MPCAALRKPPTKQLSIPFRRRNVEDAGPARKRRNDGGCRRRWGDLNDSAPQVIVLYMRTDRIVRARQHLLHQLSIDLYRRWSAGRDESTALRVCCEQAFHILYSVLLETPILLGVNVSPASPLNIRKVPDGRSGGLACIYAMLCRAMPSWLGNRGSGVVRPLSRGFFAQQQVLLT